MKNILTIVIRLTLSCILAGTVMGTTYVFTSNAKKHNEHVNEQKVMLSLLGYTKDKPAPDSMAMHEVYRYVVTEGDVLSLGYLVPEQGHVFTFVTIDLNGTFLATMPVDISHDLVIDDNERAKAITTALGAGKSLRYADKTIVVTDNGQRMAYLLPGAFPGFKTFISVMLALDPSFTILGLEIMEHEEDPGLGGEIVQDYFKNQFKGKPFAVLKKLKVAKTPIPAEYLKALEAKKSGMTAADVATIQEQYKDKDIYALTGATISSRSVTNGAKAIVKKFAYRISILDGVLKEQQIAVPF
ncbi:MAG: FMN-binding protein [Proteobacteria bacterium]|nr:FMN-binding protein [Pseudomonadota bacterium]MBU1639674.1 FMN-binding protein [Pseudomonadota bacterium]